MRKGKAAEQSRCQVDEARREADRYRKWADLQAWEGRCKKCYGAGTTVARGGGKLTHVTCDNCNGFPLAPYLWSAWSSR